MRSLKNKIKLLLKVLFLSVLGIMIAWKLFWFWGAVGVFSHQTYSKEKWLAIQTNETDSTCYRGGMAMYIKEFLLKNTMSKTDVISLLGKPDMETPNQIEYTLGMCSGLRIDYDGLVINFNQNDKLTNASIIQH